jgi:hypothetical protein
MELTLRFGVIAGELLNGSIDKVVHSFLVNNLPQRAGIAILLAKLLERISQSNGEINPQVNADFADYFAAESALICIIYGRFQMSGTGAQRSPRCDETSSTGLAGYLESR